MTIDAAGQTDERVARQVSHRPLLAALLSAAAGVLLSRLLPAAAPWGWLLAALAWLCWLWLYRRGRWPQSASLALLLSAAGLAAAWHHTCWCEFGADEIGLFAREWTEPVCVRGRALSAAVLSPAPPPDPMRTMSAGDTSRLAFQVDAIRDRDRWLSASGRLDVSVSGQLQTVRPGDRLQICGKFATVLPPANPGERDRAADARRDRRLCGMWCRSPDCVSPAPPRVADSGGGLLSRISRAMAELRDRGNRLLWRTLSHRSAGLAAAVLLGQREELTYDDVAAYVETGTIHLLVIAGLHVAILAWALALLLRLGWLSRRWGLALIAGLTIFYAMLTNAQPSVVRATVLVVVFCLSFFSGQRREGFNALALAGLVLLAMNPADLLSVGPQLSFLAVGTLIWFAARTSRRRPDPLDDLLAQARPWPSQVARWAGGWLVNCFLAGLAISLVALPLVMHDFHLVTPWGAVLMPLLIPPMAAALLGGMGVLLFGWLLPPVAALCGGLCDLCLSLISDVVQWVHSLPASHFWVAGPPAWWLIGFYAALGAAALWPRLAPPRRWCVAILSGWIAVWFGASALPHGHQVRCTILSVGHGSAVVLELPGSRVMVCDAGRLGIPDFAAEAIADCLWSRGYTHIDAIVLSHGDADHYNAVPRLLTQFSVGAVYVSPVMLEHHGRAVGAMFDAVRQAGVPLRTTWSGQRFAVGPVDIEVLHPPRQGVLVAKPSMMTNANCIVLAVQYAGRRLLLPGDIETPGLEDLLSEEPWPCDVLMAPHHGSPNNDPEGVLRWCTPRWNIVSGGEDENLTVIRAASQRHGAQLLHTAEDGAVVATLGEQGVTVEAFRPRGVGRPRD